MQCDDHPLNDSLVQKWGAGEISAKTVLEIAAGGTAQGAVGADLLGSVKHSQNAQRALIGQLGFPEGAPAFVWVEIPTKAGPRTAHPFLLPHLWFESLFKVEDMWSARVAGDDGGPLRFWRSMKHTSIVKEHPCLTEEDWPKAIPFGTHGDGGGGHSVTATVCMHSPSTPSLAKARRSSHDS